MARHAVIFYSGISGLTQGDAWAGVVCYDVARYDITTAKL